MLAQRIKRFLGLGGGGNCRGLTIIEALLATALLGIGFAGMFTIFSVSSQSMQQSIARQKLQLQANQILDVIESDKTNIDQYVLDLTVCVAPPVGTTQTSLLRSYEWCQRLGGELGAAVPGEVRSVNVTTLADGKKIVHITLEGINRTAQVTMKRIYEGS